MRSRPRGGGPGAAGFTLLEILVALVVLGFLLVGLSEGVRFGVRAWDSETKLVNRRADMDAMERVLRGLVEAADPGGFNEPTPFRGHPHTLSLVSRLPMAAQGLVTRNAEFGLGVDAKHRLVLRWTLHPHAERLTAPPPPHETVLLEGVEQVTLGYERAPERGGGWTDTWALPTLPELVRITIDFPTGDRRHWPTIVVAPMSSRSDQ